MTRVPLRLRVGQLPSREVFQLSAESLALNPDAALVHALRAVADEIERQATEETGKADG